jgi:hypothetical protein
MGWKAHRKVNEFDGTSEKDKSRIWYVIQVGSFLRVLQISPPKKTDCHNSLSLNLFPFLTLIMVFQIHDTMENSYLKYWTLHLHNPHKKNHKTISKCRAPVTDCRCKVLDPNETHLYQVKILFIILTWKAYKYRYKNIVILYYMESCFLYI